MLEELTGSSVYSQIMMEEPPPVAVLLVEGPDEDAILFDHISSDAIRIIAGNKKAVLDAARLAEEHGITSVLGLVDRDFDTLRNRDGYPTNVVSTDAYDLVADVVATIGDEAMRRILHAHAARAVRTVESKSNRNIVDTVFEIAGRLAPARLACLCLGYPLVFANFDFRPVITDEFGAEAVGLYARYAKSRDESFRIDDSVVDEISARQVEAEQRQHVGGHDIVAAAAAVLAKAGGQVAKKSIAGNLISFATCEVLRSMPCVQRLNALSKQRLGAPILHCYAA